MIALGQGSKRHILLAAITASAGLFITIDASFAGDNPACNPKAGTCYEINKTPGCAIAVCCNIVCDVDSLCCDVEWDLICVDFAVDLCATCPGKGSCFEDGDTPSCDDAACCEIVCTIDAFCCHTVWDLICVGEAELLCLNEPCDLKCPAGAIPEFDLCDEDTNGGCNPISIVRHNRRLRIRFPSCGKCQWFRLQCSFITNVRRARHILFCGYNRYRI